MATDPNRARIPEVAVSASAAVGGFASLLAWAACCVLPLVLSIAGVSFAGVAVFAGARHWLTPIAAAVLAVGWLLHWRRSRMCRRDTACGRPSPLAFWLLVVATLLIVLSLAWEGVLRQVRNLGYGVEVLAPLQPSAGSTMAPLL